MTRKNVTVAVEDGVLKEARHIAVERGMSLSALLGKTLEEIVKKEKAYRRARKRQAALLDAPVDLGTRGHVRWTRDELHDR